MTTTTTRDTLAQQPVSMGMDPDRFKLLKATLNQKSKTPLTDADIAAGLEIAVRYDLDLFAGEAWITKSDSRVMLMVGRDGLRKIAAKNNLRADRDYVCTEDTFLVARNGGTPIIKHEYGHPAQRGEIVAAYCAVYERGEAGEMLGWYVALMSEFRPRSENKLKHSPWGAQESVMILAAAERQAFSQATPLSGLLVEGETARNEEMAEAAPIEVAEPLGKDGLWAMVSKQHDDDTADAVLSVVARAEEAGHAGLADTGTIGMLLDGQSSAYLAKWREGAIAEMDALENAEPEPVASDG